MTIGRWGAFARRAASRLSTRGAELLPASGRLDADRPAGRWPLAAALTVGGPYGDEVEPYGRGPVVK